MSKAGLVQDVISTDPVDSAFSPPPTPRGAPTFVLWNPDGERQPLLGHPDRPQKKFYRARPMWLVPFAILAAVVRGMVMSPRIEVLTNLSCTKLRHPYNHTSIDYPIPAHHTHHSSNHTYTLTFPASNDADTESDDTRSIPSRRCLSDPAVQAGAARLQTIITIISGSLSALTTGWWGSVGERHGRMRVLAASTLGLFLTDLMFILVSTPNSPFAAHGHKLLIVAPLFEGILGGWSTLQSATSAYVSDCTSAGSRAQIFSRFTGVFFLGASFGPILGAWLIQHPWSGTERNVTTVFWVAVMCSFVNLLLVLFVFPESLSVDKRSPKAKGKSRATEQDAEGPSDSGKSVGIVSAFLSPLAVFLPQKVYARGRPRTDWSMTFLAIMLLGYMISTGINQIKYLYATHAYGWGAEELGYYISWLSGSRAVQLLFVLPFVIATFKPRSKPTKNTPKAIKAHLAREIYFDLKLTRFSLLLDLISSTSVVIAPYPASNAHALLPSAQSARSQTMFVIASSISTLASGVGPAAQSLALCILQSRALAREEGGEDAKDAVPLDVGKLFGALAVLQAVGQMIVGPMIFGLIYSGTVATFPKAIWVTAAGFLFVGFVLTFFVRPPHAKIVASGKGKGATVARPPRKPRVEVEVVRGRSRASKDLTKTYTMAGSSSQ